MRPSHCSGPSKHNRQNPRDRFKGDYRNNLHSLASERFEKKKPINVNNLPLLVFGGGDPETGPQLTDAFNKLFSKENCLLAWRKCGAVPLTRSPMNDTTI